MNGLRKNFIYNSFYQILTVLLPLVTTPYISRVLGADGVGLYAYSFSIAKYFVIFAMLGLSNYGNRTIAAVRDNQEKLNITFSEIWAMQLFTAGVSLIAYLLYAFFVAHNIMAFILIAYVFSSVLDVNWFFFGMEQFKLTVIRNTIIKILSVSLIFIFVKSNTDVYKYGLIMALSFLLSNIAILPFINKYARLVKPSVRGIISHFRANLILFIPVVAISLYKTMDKIMLGTISTMESVGFYENAESILVIPIVLVQSLGTVMLPKISNLAANNKIEESMSYLSKSIIISMFLSSSMGFGIMAVSKEFVPWFYGKGFDACINLFLILSPSCIFMALANVIRTQYLIPNHIDKPYIISVFIGAIINLVINAILIPTFNSNGAAIGTLIAEMIVCVYQVSVVKKYGVDIRTPIIKSLPFLLASIAMFTVVFFMRIQSQSQLIILVIKIALGVIVFFVFLLFELYIIKQTRHNRKLGDFFWR